VDRHFKKHFENYTQGQFFELVGHSEEIWKALEQSEFITPRVLGSSDGIIYYEYLDIPFRIDEVWKKDLDIDPVIFKKIGEMLLLIHNSSLDSLMHGDYVLHNIFLNSSEDLCLIDCHPPEVVGYDRSFLYGDGQIETYLFLLNLASSLGVKLALANIKSVRLAMLSFRRGYDSIGGLRPLVSAIIRFYKIRRASGYSDFNSLMHLLIGLFFIGVSRG
tara:strand:- start:10288 stop:10941 length:654 start_codon:yes stop_codon:yes gene_type:complete